jgi:hypothetical protein
MPATTIATNQFQYDSDFSEASTNASSDVEDDLEPSIKSKIPYFCLKPPDIPNGRFVWNCLGCDYYIDLLNLSPDILNHLPDDTKRVLGGKSWKVKEEPIQRLLCQAVSNHYRDRHLSDLLDVQSLGNTNDYYVKDRSLKQQQQQQQHRDWKTCSTRTKVKEELVD